MKLKGGRCGRGDGERGDKGITQLKTNVISAAAERKQCLLLGGCSIME